METHDGYKIIQRILADGEFPKSFLETLKIDKWSKTKELDSFSRDGMISFSIDFIVKKLRIVVKGYIYSNWCVSFNFKLIVYRGKKTQKFKDSGENWSKINTTDIKNLLNDVGISNTKYYLVLMIDILNSMDLCI